MKIIVVETRDGRLLINCENVYYSYEYEENRLTPMFEIKCGNFIHALKGYPMFEIEVDTLSMDDIFKQLPELLL